MGLTQLPCDLGKVTGLRFLICIMGNFKVIIFLGLQSGLNETIQAKNVDPQ
jgi:hypothetical protein